MSTALNAALWAIMAVSIVVVWLAAVPIAVLLLRTDLGDPARALAIRAGLLIALIGMALAFLMTGPTAAQLTDSFSPTTWASDNAADLDLGSQGPALS